jgi:hypothetical protein
MFFQSLTALFENLIEMPHAGSGPVKGCSDPVFVSRSTVSFQAIPS